MICAGQYVDSRQSSTLIPRHTGSTPFFGRRNAMSASYCIALVKLLCSLLLVAAMPAMAETAASIWQEDEDSKLHFDDSALGTWCYAKNNQLKQFKDTTVYERNQNC